jgi:hypothetical protein
MRNLKRLGTNSRDGGTGNQNALLKNCDCRLSCKTLYNHSLNFFLIWLRCDFHWASVFEKSVLSDSLWTQDVHPKFPNSTHLVGPADGEMPGLTALRYIEHLVVAKVGDVRDRLMVLADGLLMDR